MEKADPQTPTSTSLFAVASTIDNISFLAISLVGPEDFDELVSVTYASDRDYVPKGMIEVVAWR